MRLNGWGPVTAILLAWLVCYIGIVTLISQKFGKIWALLFVLITFGPQYVLAMTGRVVVADEAGKFHIKKITGKT